MSLLLRNESEDGDGFSANHQRTISEDETNHLPRGNYLPSSSDHDGTVADVPSSAQAFPAHPTLSPRALEVAGKMNVAESSMSPRTAEALMMGRWLEEPELGLWMIHNNGRGMPTNDLELQDILHCELSPSYSLSAIKDITPEKAACVIWAELDTNFCNCLAHIREARKSFPGDVLFSQADLQIISYLRDHPPADTSILSCGTVKTGGAQHHQQKKGFFSKLFGKDEKKDKKKGKGKSGEPDEVEDEATGFGSNTQCAPVDATHEQTDFDGAAGAPAVERPISPPIAMVPVGEMTDIPVSTSAEKKKKGWFGGAKEEKKKDKKKGKKGNLTEDVDVENDHQED